MRGLLVLAAAVGILIVSAGCKAPPQGASQASQQPASTAEASADQVTSVDGASFDEKVLKADLPVLVDFYAVWCGPCKQLAPFLDEMAVKRAGSLNIVRVDVDWSVDLANRYHVDAMPTLVLFRSGKEEKRWIGVADPDAFAAEVDAAAK